MIKIFAYNNSYGNFAGKYLSQCLPNIRGIIAPINTPLSFIGDGKACPVEEKDSALGYRIPNEAAIGAYGEMQFNASGYNSIYRDNCGAVRPSSYVVYMWVRTS